MASEFEFGSAEWFEEVFSSPPVRDVMGRSHPTQRFVLSKGGGMEPAEGKTGALPRLLLSSGINCGLVRRYKLEAFYLEEKIHGVDAVPDVLFEHVDGRKFVVEGKSEEYLSPEVIEKCRRIEKIVGDAGMSYLLWTDSWPLTNSMARVLRSMRRCGTSAVPQQQVENLITRISYGEARWSELRDAGIFRDAILHAVWRGRAHLNIFEDLCDYTLVSPDVGSRRFEDALEARINTHEWWQDLSHS
jgi:uncharacterized protein YlzI (FlbEa/FlbD family)